MAKAIEVELHIAAAPAPGEQHECGAGAEFFQKHDVYKGGRCGSCGEWWFPGLSIVRERTVEVEITVEPTADGGAILHFDE